MQKELEKRDHRSSSLLERGSVAGPWELVDGAPGQNNVVQALGYDVRAPSPSV